MKGRTLLFMLLTVFAFPFVCLAGEVTAAPTSTEYATSVTLESTPLNLEELLRKKEELQEELLKLEQLISQYLYSALGQTTQVMDTLRSAQEELARLKEDLESVKAGTAASVTHLETQLTELSKELESLSDQLQTLLDRLESLDQRIAQVEAKTRRPQLWDFLILGVALIALALPFVIPR
ncbi:MAG: hypothetical protein J7J80_02630 [Thermotogae bacterium]|nr:hypothetical protein [Thermotogota bacterium]